MLDDIQLLTSPEVAALFLVEPKTVSRWAKAGKIAWIKTPGGEYRYPESEVRELLSKQVTVRRS